MYPAAAAKSLQSCPTLCDPIDGSPTRFPSPWDSPGKNTGVGCHFLLQLDYCCAKLSNLWQNRPVFQYPLLALNSFKNGISNIPNNYNFDI